MLQFWDQKNIKLHKTLHKRSPCFKVWKVFLQVMSFYSQQIAKKKKKKKMNNNNDKNKNTPYSDILNMQKSSHFGLSDYL